MKFDPAHFPVGTTFMVDPSLMREADTPKSFTVQTIIRNGARSHVLETVEKHKWLDGSIKNYAFNIQHVDRILMRGHGPVEIKSNYFTGGGRTPALIRDQELMVICDPKFLRFHGIQPRKGNIVTGSIHTTVMFYAAPLVPPDVGIDYLSLVRAVLTQTWCVKRKIGLTVHELNRKRLRRFISATWTQHLVNLRKAERAEQAEMDRYYDDLSKEDIHDNED